VRLPVLSELADAAQIRRALGARSGMIRRASRLVLVAAVIAAVAASASTARAQVIGSTGGAFELTDHNGRPFSSTRLAGRPYALFFGYTNCPDVCPTTLLEMTNLLRRFGDKADRLAVLFITVDPEQDTPEHLRVYLGSFDPRIIALTGSPEQIAQAAQGWKAHYHKLPNERGSGYEVVHSAW
jgi:protein SCO1/2